MIPPDEYADNTTDSGIRVSEGSDGMRVLEGSEGIRVSEGSEGMRVRGY